MTIESIYCKTCQKVTDHIWQYDPDSEPGEALFMLICTICGRESVPTG